jgi:hypothetical protein
MRSPTFFLSGLTILSTFVAQSHSTSVAHSVKKVFQFAFPTWVENIAVRANGDLLVTLLPVTPLAAAELRLVDPSANPPTSKLIYSFNGTNITGLLGIAELEHDVFAFVAGTIPQTATPGVYSIWKADLRREPATVSKIADVSSGQLLNGLAKLNEHALLIGDSMAGNVVKLDLKTGKSISVLEDASMKSATVNGAFMSGVNGLKVQDPYVYYTNSALASLHRVRIDCGTGRATGPFETLATDMPSADDFALQKDSTAFVAVGSGNVIEEVTASGAQSVFAGGLNSSAIPGPTAAALGRGAGRDVLYVVTNGAIKNKVNGTFVEGGSVIAVGLR